jgi:hypothetical protein
MCSYTYDMPCSLFKVNRRFRDTCRLHLQGSRITKETSTKHVASTASYIPDIIRDFVKLRLVESILYHKIITYCN